MTSRRTRRARHAGQALVEYMFLFVLLATITVGVVALAGQQLYATYQDVQVALDNLGGTDVSGSGPFTCPDGTPAVLRGHNYHCHP